MLRARLLSVLLAIPALASCAAMEDVTCEVGADCPSGVCNADGTCREVSTGGASSASSASGHGGSGGDGGSGGSGGGSGGSSVCSPNNDGSITHAEVPLAPGLHATFRTAENVTVDTAGTMNGDGSRSWDLSGTLAGDHGQLVETLPLTGQWFAADFPGASYVSKLSDTSDVLGVFEINDAVLLLRGIASPTPGATQTKLVYQPPVEVLSFPIQADKMWSTASTATGQLNGVPGFINETYTSHVDAHGDLKTPFGSFPVQRIRVDLTRVAGALVTTTATFLFVTECFGTVANIVSQTNELAFEFTNAAEISRLAP